MKTIAPIDRNQIKAELCSDTFLRNTRKGNNQIHVVNIHNSPNILQEIGRLREITFRASGGGTGNSIDLDHYDTDKTCYEQLIVWSVEDEEIIGGYRYIKCKNAITETGNIQLSTTHYFEFSKPFIDKYLPYTIELGRSWVQPSYQPSINPRKGLFALDNIWDGLGALIKLNPEIRYFFGKVTMYPNYPVEARDFLLQFMHYFFPDNENLLSPHNPLNFSANKDIHLDYIKGLEFKEAYKVLNTFIRERSEFIPPLISIYMNLSPSMKTFGTAINSDFGNVEETAILVTISEIYTEKKERHMDF